MEESTGEELSWLSISVFFSIVADFISFLTVHNESNCSLVFLEIWYKYQQRHIVLSQLHSNSKHPFLRMLTRDQGPLLRVQQLD